MSLHKTIESFYLNTLSYAGLSYENNIIINTDKRFGDFTIDGKNITLPYFENLKNPNNRIILHLLNENYVKPDTALFNLYKKRLVTEINLKLLSLFTTLIEITADTLYANKIKNAKLSEIVAAVGTVDLSFIEALLNLTKISKKHNDEAFILDLHLRKNGEINDVPYAAIGKVNFILYKEIMKGFDSTDGYKVYECKLRKKDLITFRGLFELVFPNIQNEEIYQDCTDNKVFRYLNILLKTAYLVSSRINYISEMICELTEYKDKQNDIMFNHSWISDMEKVYDLTDQIRLIPNQTDMQIESKLNVNESKVTNVTPQAIQSAPVLQPMQQLQQPNIVPMQTSTPTAEDILRGSGQPYVPYVQQPQMFMQPQPQMPQWMLMEHMQNNAQTMQQPMVNPMLQQQMIQQPMMNPMLQQQLMQQQMMNSMMQQPMMNPMMQMQPNTGLQVNPMFLNNNRSMFS